MKFKKTAKTLLIALDIENRLIYQGEPGATKLELFKPLRESILLHWKLQNFDQNIFTGAGEYQGFVDYFKY